MSKPDTEGMQALAETMLAAGCEVVVALTDTPGVGIFAVADGVGFDRVVRDLRGLADSIEQLRPGDEIGRVEVEVKDE